MPSGRPARCSRRRFSSAASGRPARHTRALGAGRSACTHSTITVRRPRVRGVDARAIRRSRGDPRPHPEPYNPRIGRQPRTDAHAARHGARHRLGRRGSAHGVDRPGAPARLHERDRAVRMGPRHLAHAPRRARSRRGRRRSPGTPRPDSSWDTFALCGVARRSAGWTRPAALIEGEGGRLLGHGSRRDSCDRRDRAHPHSKATLAAAEQRGHDALVAHHRGGFRLQLVHTLEALAGLAAAAGLLTSSARASPERRRRCATRWATCSAGRTRPRCATPTSPRPAPRSATTSSTPRSPTAARSTRTRAVAYAQRARGERKRPTTGWDSLTPTEVNVVRLVASGLTNKEVGRELLMGAETVKTHLSHVYDKLGVRSRAALVTEYAARA